ncbi:conserved protein of unknown function [Rhodovastum atsumiense]|uniref:Uncharacterized protein n=1 Tax=Rhodovastum atsumiense TaxID=504468 RepID=A0A5M6IJX4_9PROT|nr:hypothetical protein [Rhodovastum atsumiense]KAA5607985.1 hypothetical protein F1189_31220 [Rhodovastum atsumiense]CAH2603473.1 conserved protein of unknown function [Rhodovastum atsumiense]
MDAQHRADFDNAGFHTLQNLGCSGHRHHAGVPAVPHTDLQQAERLRLLFDEPVVNQGMPGREPQPIQINAKMLCGTVVAQISCEQRLDCRDLVGLLGDIDTAPG